MNSVLKHFSLIELVHVFHSYIFGTCLDKKIIARFIEAPWAEPEYRLRIIVGKTILASNEITVPNWLVLTREFLHGSPADYAALSSNHPDADKFAFKSICFFERQIRGVKNEVVTEKFLLTFIPGFNYYVVTIQSNSILNSIEPAFAIGKMSGKIDPESVGNIIMKSFLFEEKQRGRGREILKTTSSFFSNYN